MSRRRVLTEPSSRRGRASRVKGFGWEREIAALLRERTGLSSEVVKRGLGQARSKGEVPDVLAPFLWVEAKRMKRVNIPKALAQATEDEARHRGEALIPVVIGKSDHEPATVTLHLEDFLAIYVEWMRAKTSG